MNMILNKLNHKLVANSLILCLTVFTANLGYSQSDTEDDETNLLKNGSFEEFDGKLKKLGQFYNVTDWFTPTKERADVFGPMGEIEDIKTPLNARGK